MNKFLEDIINDRLNQIQNAAEREKEEGTNTSENVKSSMNVSKTFLEILKFSYKIKLNAGEKKEKKKTKKMASILEGRLNPLFQSVTTSETGFDDVIALAIAYFNLGYQYFAEGNINNTAKNNFSKCIELLKGKELERTAILTALEVYNCQAYLWKKLQRLDNYYLLSEKAMELYLNYTKKIDYPYPINVATVFDIEDKDVNINTKFRLVELYQTALSSIESLYHNKPLNKHKFVIHVHNLLTEDLFGLVTEKGVHHYWANTSLCLCYYFIHYNRFEEAENHLLTARYVIDYLQEKIFPKLPEPGRTEMYQNYVYVCALLSKQWGAFGVALLSWQQTLQYESSKSCETNNVKLVRVANEELSKPLLFPKLYEIKSNTFKFENTELSLEKAKQLFKEILNSLDLAKFYYTIERDYLAHVDILIHISKAYKYYLHFERSKHRQIKLIEERIKCLENLISIITPQRNILVTAEMHKILCGELAIAYSTLLEFKEEFEEIEEVTDEMSEETDELVKHIIDNFNLAIF